MTPPRWMVAPFVLVCLVAYGQVVSGVGLLIWLTPAAVIAAGVVGLTRIVASQSAAKIAVWPALAVTTFAWAALVELLSGDTSGPVSRSSLMVGGLTGAMSVILLTRYKPLILLPATAMFAGALALGAAGGLVELTALFAAVSVFTLLRLGPHKFSDLQDRPRVLSIAAIVLVAGLTAVAGTAISATLMDEKPWEIAGAEANRAPTSTTEPETAASPTPTPTAKPAPSPTPTAVTEDPFETIGADVLNALKDTVLPAVRNVALALLALLALWLAISLGWRIWVGTRWIAIKRRLAAGDPRNRVLGAWTWTRLRLDQSGRHLPPSASPDVVAAGGGIDDLPQSLHRDLTKLAFLAARAGFSEDDGTQITRDMRRDAARAWALARDVEAQLRRERSIRQWWTSTAKRADFEAISERVDEPQSVG